MHNPGLRSNFKWLVFSR